jgi:hypothetical protein
MVAALFRRAVPEGTMPGRRPHPVMMVVIAARNRFCNLLKIDKKVKGTIPAFNSIATSPTVASL